jgi:hypothetical protein
MLSRILCFKLIVWRPTRKCNKIQEPFPLFVFFKYYNLNLTKANAIKNLKDITRWLLKWSVTTFLCTLITLYTIIPTTHSYADCLLKNTSIRHNKYAVKQNLEHVDDINFRDVFGRIRVVCFKYNLSQDKAFVSIPFEETHLD